MINATLTSELLDHRSSAIGVGVGCETDDPRIRGADRLRDEEIHVDAFVRERALKLGAQAEAVVARDEQRRLGRFREPRRRPVDRKQLENRSPTCLPRIRVTHDDLRLVRGGQNAGQGAGLIVDLSTPEANSLDLDHASLVLYGPTKAKGECQCVSW